MRRRMFLICTPALLFAPGVSAQHQPDFSGRWEMDAGRSVHQPADEAVAEEIDQQSAKLVIRTTLRRPAKEERNYAIRLTTDNAENLNIVLGREMTTKTVWEGDKLVTHVRDRQGMQFYDVRMLADGGRTQIVEGFMDPSRQRPMFRHVMVKKGGAGK